jgi:phytoene/squalene synthetase
MSKGYAKSHMADNASSIYNIHIRLYHINSDLYCTYVAGLIVEGPSRLFSVWSNEAPWLGNLPELSFSTGLLLQKANFTRDFNEVPVLVLRGTI